jgi:hypothetical protein
MLTQRSTGTTQGIVLAEPAAKVWPDKPPPPTPSNHHVLWKVMRAAKKVLKESAL